MSDASKYARSRIMKASFDHFWSYLWLHVLNDNCYLYRMPCCYVIT